MKITKTKFGVHNGEEIYLFTLDNEKGLSCEILNYGGIIRKLVYNGTDVVLGYETFEEYLKDGAYFGAIVGRFANRIAGARFCLNGKEYILNKNNGNNNLHGGIAGFNKKIWNAESTENSLVLTLTSPDGDEGFPGNLDVSVIYKVTDDNALEISYFATSDQDTVVSMTNHAYFNLDGHFAGNAENHLLEINASSYTPVSEELIPTGEIRKTEGSAFDFSKLEVIKKKIAELKEETGNEKGFDHNFVLDGEGLRKVATLVGGKSKITMETYTDCPGMQLYTEFYSKEKKYAKDDATYSGFVAVCLETQNFPDCINQPDFPSPVLKKGEEYKTKTVYKFK